MNNKIKSDFLEKYEEWRKEECQKEFDSDFPTIRKIKGYDNFYFFKVFNNFPEEDKPFFLGNNE